MFKKMKINFKKRESKFLRKFFQVVLSHLVSHDVDPELTGVLRLDTPGAEQPELDMPANAAPLELYCLVPTQWVPNLQMQGSQPTAKTCLGHPEDGGQSGWEDFG